MESLYTKKQLADLLRVSVRTIDRLRLKGDLRAIKVLKAIRFVPEEVRRYLEPAAHPSEGGK